MAKDYPRSYRVADQIQRELAQLIRSEVKDPRVPSTLTVAAVEVSKDLSNAKVYISTFDLLSDEQMRNDAIDGLNQAANYLRKLLGNSMRMRTIPNLNFYYDNVQEDASRLSTIIDEAVSTNTTAVDDEPHNSEQGQR